MVILLTDRQTDRHRLKHNRLLGGNDTMVVCAAVYRFLTECLLSLWPWRLDFAQTSVANCVLRYRILVEPYVQGCSRLFRFASLCLRHVSLLFSTGNYTGIRFHFASHQAINCEHFAQWLAAGKFVCECMYRTYSHSDVRFERYRVRNRDEWVSE